MTKKSVVLLTGLIFVSTILTGQVRKTIIPTLNPGEQYIFKNTTINDIHEDGVRTINQTYTANWFLRVIGKTADGKVMMKATYLKIQQRTEHLFTHEATGFNSDDFKEYVVKSLNDDLHAQNDRLRKLCEGMMGKSFTLYFDDNLRINKVTGVDTLIENALIGMDEQASPALQSFQKTTRGTINNEEIWKVFDGAFVYIPDEAVGTGDKWSKDENHNVGPLKVNYVVKSEEDSNMEIAVSSAAAINSDIQVSYSRKGTITVDTKTGLLVQSSIKDDMKPRAGNITRLVIKTVKNELQKK